MKTRRRFDCWTRCLSVLALLIVTFSSLMPPGAIVQAQEQTTQQIAYVCEGGLCLIDADGRNRTQIVQVSDGFIRAYAWSPDGQQIVYVHEWPGGEKHNYRTLTDIYLLDVDAKKETLLAQDVWYWVYGGIAWSPVGGRIAFLASKITPDGTRVYTALEMLYPSTGEITSFKLMDGPMGMGAPTAPAMNAISWAPDDKFLAANVYGADAFVVSLDKEPAIQLRVSQTGKNWSHPQVSPQGDLIAWINWGADDAAVVITDIDGRVLTRIPANQCSRSHMLLAWSPNGDLLAMGGEDGLCLADTNSQAASSMITGQGVWDPSWSPDGSSIVVSLLELLDGRWLVPTKVAYIQVSDRTPGPVILDGDLPSWRKQGEPIQALPSLEVDLDDLLARKQDAIDELESPEYPEFDGYVLQPLASMLVGKKWGYDEQDAQDLLDRTRETHSLYLDDEMSPEEAWAFVDQSDAFSRLTLVEETLLDLYPLYWKTGYDLIDTVVDVVRSVLGLTKAIDHVKSLAEKMAGKKIAKPIARTCDTINDHIFKIVESELEFVEKQIKDESLRESFHQLRTVLIVSLQAQQGEMGDVVKDVAITALKQGLTYTLLCIRYFPDTQPVISLAVHTADPAYSGTDKLPVKGDYSRANQVTTRLIQQAEENTAAAHLNKEDWDSKAKIADIVSDIGAIASLSGVGSGIGAQVAAAAKAIAIIMRTIGSAMGFSNLEYLYDSALHTSSYSFDPEQPFTLVPTGQVKGSGLLLFPHGSPMSSEPLYLDNLTRLEAGISDFETALAQVLDALETEDTDTVGDAVSSLLDADDAVGQEFRLAQRQILAADSLSDPRNEMLYQSLVDFDVSSMVLYAYLIDNLLAPEDAGLRMATREQSVQVTNVLNEIKNELDTIVTSTGSPVDRSVVFFQSHQVPEQAQPGQAFDIQIKLQNIGGQQADDVTLRVLEPDEQLTQKSIALDTIPSLGTIEATIPVSPHDAGTWFLQLEVAVEDEITDSMMVVFHVTEPDPDSTPKPTQAIATELTRTPRPTSVLDKEPTAQAQKDKEGKRSTCACCNLFAVLLPVLVFVLKRGR